MGDIFIDLKRRFLNGSLLYKIIYINVAVFLILRLSIVLLALFNIDGTFLLHYLQMPSDLTRLLTHPWTIITYQFLQYDILHILFNMLWLYWFSKLFLMFFSERTLVSVYLLGGSGGAIFYLLSYNIFPFFESVSGTSYLMGASASVLAIVIATATYSPNMKLNLLFIGEVKLKYLALFTIILDLMQITSSNAGGHIAHLGGALFGFIFVKQLLRGRDLTIGLSALFDKLFNLFKPRPKMKVKYKRPVTDYEYNVIQKEKSQELDRILDKLKKSGYNSLTREEKKQLFDAGK